MLAPQDEANLALRLQMRDVDALHTFYEHYTQPAFKTILAIVELPDKAEDVLQESFVQVLRTIDSYEPAYHESFSIWLLSLCRNKAIDYRRAQQPSLQVPSAHLNTTITHDGVKYGVYWTTAAAAHVAANYADPTHNVTHYEVVQLLKRARYAVSLEEEKGRPHYYVFLTGRLGYVWETYVYLVPAITGWPPRCVIVTCYKSNKEQYRSLFAS